MTYGDPSPLTMGFIVLLVAVGYGREYAAVAVEKWREWNEPEPYEKLREEYVRGELDRPEFERRVEELLDPEHQRIRDRLMEIDGIGETVAGEIALEYHSIEHVRRAPRGELESVPDVGPARAKSIDRHFS